MYTIYVIMYIITVLGLKSSLIAHDQQFIENVKNI